MIHSFEYCLKRGYGWGQVSELSQLIVKVKSLEGAKMGEGVVFEGGEAGRVMMVGQGSVQVLRLTGARVVVGERVVTTGESLMVSCGDGLLGKVVDGLGYSLGEGRDKSKETENRVIETYPPGIAKRSRITEFAQTGLTILDVVIPLGKGQRELLLGERKSGKTRLAINAMAAQVKAGAIGVYGLIGKRASDVALVVAQLTQMGVMNKCVIVAAEASGASGEVYVAPFTAMAIAEYFRDQGQEVCLVLDDLSTHAKYYREIGLSGGQFPGRESYPGDIFYTHARLLERAGNFKVGKKIVAITAIVLAETLGGEITGYITTNLMSITDGHWYLDNELFLAGMRPAVNVFLSVTRVGRQTQPKSLRLLGEELLRILKAEAEVSRFVRFGTELTPQAQMVAERGARVRILLNQTTRDLRPWQLSVYLMARAWEQTLTQEGIAKSEAKYRNVTSWRARIADWIEHDGTWDRLLKTVPSEGSK